MKIISVIEKFKVTNTLVTDEFADKVHEYITNSTPDVRPAMAVANGVYPDIIRLTGIVFILEVDNFKQYLNGELADISDDQDFRDPKQVMDHNQLILINYAEHNMEYKVILYSWRLTLKDNPNPENIQAIRDLYQHLYTGANGHPPELTLEEFLEQDTLVAMDQLFPIEMREAMDKLAATVVESEDSSLANAKPVTDTLQ